MDISKINDPSFLKEYNSKQCQELADEIRHFLIENVSKTGGHLSSNLGVVELTIALHRVFDSPKDKIFFDVGHQCYTHKILTGRANRFNTLRQYEGISGFQKRAESVHDVWEAGHSSTSLSAAIAMAVSRDLNKENYSVIPVIGDGAMSSGMSLEALNQIGALQKPLIIIFNDNNMSISQNVGALTKAFSKLRTSTPYTGMKDELKQVLEKNDFGQSILKGMTNFKDGFKKSILEAGVFDEFGLDYLGPVDGHDIKALTRVLKVAKEKENPVVVHVMTKKGKGYPYCETDTEGKWHGVGSFNPDTGKLLSSCPEGQLDWSSIVSETLVRLAKTDSKLCAITPAMITGSKLEKFFALYPDRSFDCGIAEEHAMTFAAGLAMSGQKPFISVYSSFLQRAYDQINHDVCRMDLPVVIGIDRAGLVGEDGDTHHGVFDIGLLRCLPNMIVAQPKDSLEAQNLIYSAFNQNHPFAIRYPRGTVAYRVVDQLEELEIGSWSMFNDSEKNQCVVISYGPDVDRILAKVISNDLPITVVNARFIKPLDHAMLQTIAAKKKPVIIYETDMLQGGLSSAILEWCNDNHISMNIKRIGIDDQYVEQGALNLIRQKVKIDINTLFDEITANLK